MLTCCCPVFLEPPEYYRGVMFLTTNRVSTFDAAFEYRTHLAMHYAALDYQKVVSTFGDRLCGDTGVAPTSTIPR